MTAREIAKAVGKDASTVARWIQAVSCKVQEVSCKVQEAKSTSKPADYTLEETCQIIEEGLGKAAADIYRTNAANASRPAPRPLVSASLIRELRLAVKAGILSPADPRRLLGLATPPRTEQGLTSEERAFVESAFGNLRKLSIDGPAAMSLFEGSRP